jgi:hypothetical protein
MAYAIRDWTRTDLTVAQVLDLVRSKWPLHSISKEEERIIWRLKDNHANE